MKIAYSGGCISNNATGKFGRNCIGGGGGGRRGGGASWDGVMKLAYLTALTNTIYCCPRYPQRMHCPPKQFQNEFDYIHI